MERERVSQPKSSATDRGVSFRLSTYIVHNAWVGILVRAGERHAGRELDSAVSDNLDLDAVGVELGAPDGVNLVGRVRLVEADHLCPDEVAARHSTVSSRSLKATVSGHLSSPHPTPIPSLPFPNPLRYQENSKSTDNQGTVSVSHSLSWFQPRRDAGVHAP